MILGLQETELSRHPHKSPPQLSLWNRCNFLHFTGERRQALGEREARVTRKRRSAKIIFFFLRSSPHT